MKIVALEYSDLKELKIFTDREIGEGYYSEKELEEIFEKSSGADRNGKPLMCSLLLREEAKTHKVADTLAEAPGEICGTRFTYPPGKWSRGKGEGLNPSKWPRSLDQTGYFQSLFLSHGVQGHGWGAKLAYASIEVLKKAGAAGVVCHSWKESPNNSSLKYLEKMGFKKIAEHPLYWQHVNYNCTRCLKPPCQCTAVEMYLEFG